MKKDLRKRLEETAEVLYPYEKNRDELTEKTRNGVITLLRKAHLAGAEYGYKEAIAQAKEWLKEHSHITEEMLGNVHCSTIMTMNGMLADFESDMNKLLEEEK